MTPSANVVRQAIVAASAVVEVPIHSPPNPQIAAEIENRDQCRATGRLSLLIKTTSAKIEEVIPASKPDQANAVML